MPKSVAPVSGIQNPPFCAGCPEHTFIIFVDLQAPQVYEQTYNKQVKIIPAKPQPKLGYFLVFPVFLMYFLGFLGFYYSKMAN